MTYNYKKTIVQHIAKNLLDIQLLRILETEPMWGYKIKKTFEADVGIKLGHGALYPMLNCLEQQGFLASQRQHNAKEPKKFTR